MHEVTIRKVVNGYIVGVGCETFVFNSLTDLLEEVGLYLTNPAERIKSWEPLLKKYHEMTSEEEDVPEELPLDGGGYATTQR